MQNPIRRLAIVLALAAPLVAGVRLSSVLTDVAGGAATSQIVSIDAARVRVDVLGGKTDTSTILLLDANNTRMLAVDNARGEYREIDQAAFQQMQQKLQGAMAMMQEQMKNMPPEQRAMIEKMMAGKMPAAAPPRPQTEYTAQGASTKNGFRCTRYEGARSGEKVTEVCAAEPSQLDLDPADFQALEKLKEFSAELMKSMANMPFARAAAEFSEPQLKGFPVHQTWFENGKPVKQYDLKEVRRMSFSDADFSAGKARRVQ